MSKIPSGYILVAKKSNENFNTFTEVFYNENSDKYLITGQRQDYSTYFFYQSGLNLDWIKFDFVAGDLVEKIETNKNINKELPYISDWSEKGQDIKKASYVKHIWENFYEVFVCDKDADKDTFIFNYDVSEEFKIWLNSSKKYNEFIKNKNSVTI